jgi:hypothetical protein
MTQNSNSKFKIVTSAILLVFISGCANLGVDPWDRDLLAKPEMAINASPLDQAIDDHIYFSKEASSGGRSFAGGGCGCN